LVGSSDLVEVAGVAMHVVWRPTKRQRKSYEDWMIWQVIMMIIRLDDNLVENIVRI